MSLHDLCSGMKLLPQILVNVRFTEITILYNPQKFSKSQKEVEAELGGKGRVFIT